MVLRLHVWGPAFGLPSIDAECIAAVAYLNRIVPRDHWVLISDHEPSISLRGELPALVDGAATITGFVDIVAHLRNHHSGAYDLDYHLTQQQQIDRTAFASFLQSTAAPLVDMYLYVSSENYHNSTTSAYTAMLPWYKNYTLPPFRRDLARSRTSHLGLSSLDVAIAADDANQPGSGTASSQFEAAKRSTGLPSGQPTSLNLGRGKGLRGLLSSPIHAARFRLDGLSNELLEPLSDLLKQKDYLFGGSKPSSLDCLAFGYLALMLYPTVPQAWLKETIQARCPRLLRYITRLRGELLSGEDTKASDVWTVSSGGLDSSKTPGHSMRLPWYPAQPLGPLSASYFLFRELLTNLPLISVIFRPRVTYHIADKEVSGISSSLPSPLFRNTLLSMSGACVAALTALALQQRRYPREGDLIFYALRPGFGGFGEAGNILSVFANQLPVAPIGGF